MLFAIVSVLLVALNAMFLFLAFILRESFSFYEHLDISELEKD